MEFLRQLFGQARELASGDSAQDMVGLVVLSNSWREISCDLLCTELNALYPHEFLPPRQQGNFVVPDPEIDFRFLINCCVANAEGIYLLHNVPSPYYGFSGFARHIEDHALRRLAISQNCWLSIDLIRPVTTDAKSYRFIGRLLARLVPADAVAILVHPSRLTAVLFNDDIRRRLAQDDSIS